MRVSKRVLRIQVLVSARFRVEIAVHKDENASTDTNAHVQSDLSRA